MYSNDEVERRGASPTSNETDSHPLLLNGDFVCLPGEEALFILPVLAHVKPLSVIVAGAAQNLWPQVSLSLTNPFTVCFLDTSFTGSAPRAWA